ncbi:MAG: hypothetical protein QNJ97_19915 [Myxococcota bacterium]|nr:hypothetical protein [Myxococcota bacterium]
MPQAKQIGKITALNGIREMMVVTEKPYAQTPGKIQFLADGSGFQ